MINEMLHDNRTTSDLLNYFDLFDIKTTPGLGITSPEQTLNSADVSAQYFDINKSPLILGIAVLYSILIITSLTSNPLLIYVLLWRRKSQIKLIDIFVANLSLSDLFLTIFNIPLSLIIYFSEEWPFGSLLCQLGTYSTSCSIYVNIFTMAYISIDRYFAVTRPQISNPNYQMRKTSILLDEKTRKKIYLVLTMIWIIALILSVPQFFFSKVSRSKLKYDSSSTFLDQTNGTVAIETDVDSIVLNDAMGLSQEISEDPFKQCLLSYPIKNMKIYMIFINFSLQYLIPSLVIIYFYGKIIYHLYLNLNIEELMESPKYAKHTKKSKQPHQPVSISNTTNAVTTNQLTDDSIHLASVSVTSLNNKSNVRKKSRMRIEGLNRTRNLKKSIKVMIIIIALFLLSWLPIHLYRLVTTYIPFFEDLFNRTVSNVDKTAIELSSFGNQSIEFILQDCKKNTSDKDCVYNTINKAIKEIRVPEVQNIRINTLHNRYVFFICYFMSMSSVCYNPIVYFWLHKKFRAEVKQLFSRIFITICRCKNTQTNSLTSTNLQGLGTASNFNKRNPNNHYNKKNNNNEIIFYKKSRDTNSNDKNSDIKNIDDEDDEQLARLNSESINTNTSSSRTVSNRKKLSGSLFSSLKTRNKRFCSLSSESTASSSRKSTIDL